MAIDPNNLAGTAHVTFDDGFNTLSLWSPTNTSGTWATTWWYSNPNGNGGTLDSNGEQEWYINANYGPTASVKPWTVANGILTLTAAPASSDISPLINGYGYTSGEVNTYHSFSQTYGYFEMRARLPYGQGFWPAFWLMPENGAWPPELDIMEVLGNNTSRLYNTVHSSQTGTHVATGDNGVTVAEMSTGYHSYGVDWEPDTITWYFDGKAVYQTTTPSDMHSPMYMIANLADGGYWPGRANGQTGQMKIDYIRAYASGAGPGAPATADTTSTSTSTPSGQSYNSDNNGDHWTGTAGNDIFYLGRGGDVVTGNGGDDIFAFVTVPWAGGTITDFHAGDVLDLNGLLSDEHYTGPNAIADGYLKITSDGSGNAQVWANYNQANNHGWWLIDTLTGVAASSLSLANGVIAETGPTHAPIAGHHTVVTRDALDINDAGRDAVIFRSASTGDLGWMTADASGGQTWHAAGPSSTAFAAIGVGDFNGDGSSGVAFRNTANGEWGYMALNAAGGETWHDIGSTSLAYSAVGTGDFAGDGAWAVAFLNAATGDFGYMSVTASGEEQWTDLGSTSTAYTAYGAGDFLGNGQVGELFRNNINGDMGFMTAKAGGGETWHSIGATGTGWAVIGIGDFDGSGHDSVAFRDSSTGEWGYMTAEASGGETWHGVGPSSLGWSVLKIGDFDHSGHAEVAFRDPGTGEWGYLSPNVGGGQTWHDVGASSLDYHII